MVRGAWSGEPVEVEDKKKKIKEEDQIAIIDNLLNSEPVVRDVQEEENGDLEDEIGEDMNAMLHSMEFIEDLLNKSSKKSNKDKPGKDNQQMLNKKRRTISSLKEDIKEEENAEDELIDYDWRG